MATSSQGYTVPFPLTAIDEGSPVATWIARDGIIETVNHLADEQAQPRVNWVAADSTLLAGSQDQYLTPATLSATNALSRICEFGPFPLSIKANGATPYKLRIQIAASSSAGHAITFAATVGPNFTQSTANAATGLDTYLKYWDATSSTSPAWLTPTNGSHLMTGLTAAVSGSPRYYSTQNDSLAPYTHRATVQQSEVFVGIWCKTATVGSIGRLYGVHIAEVVGL